MNDKNEQERLKRLRERQLTDRDPHAKQRKVERKVTARRQKIYKSSKAVTPWQMFTELPHKVHGGVVCFLLGLLVLLLLPLFMDAPWAQVIAWVAPVALVLVGVLYGESFDWRDEIRDHLKDR